MRDGLTFGVSKTGYNKGLSRYQNVKENLDTKLNRMLKMKRTGQELTSKETSQIRVGKKGQGVRHYSKRKNDFKGSTHLTI